MLYDHTWLEAAEEKAGVVPAGDIMTIREMTDTDVDYAAAVVAMDGWLGETRSVFEGFLEKDPCGCFIADHDERPVGMCIATTYRACGFIGELVVEKKLRGRGFGKQLFEKSIEYLESSGARSIYLDADLDAVPFYEKNGFRKIYRMAQPGCGVMSVGPWLAPMGPPTRAER